MDKTRAVRLLDSVFNSSYSHEIYEEFIVHLLNNVRINRINENERIGVDNFFRNFVENIDYFGTYTDKTGKKQIFWLPVRHETIRKSVHE